MRGEKKMNTRQARKLIEEYLNTEYIDLKWVECLKLCKVALKEKEERDEGTIREEELIKREECPIDDKESATQKEPIIQKRELSTIQKREKLNKVYAVDEIGVGHANHCYEIIKNTCTEKPLNTIQFQKGPRTDTNSISGILDTDLLEIVRDRLKGFQSGEFSTRENACALTHIEEALMWMNRRVEDRIERNVLGTNNK